MNEIEEYIYINNNHYLKNNHLNNMYNWKKVFIIDYVFINYHIIWILYIFVSFRISIISYIYEKLLVYEVWINIHPNESINHNDFSNCLFPFDW